MWLSEIDYGADTVSIGGSQTALLVAARHRAPRHSGSRSAGARGAAVALASTTVENGVRVAASRPKRHHL